MKFLPWKKSTTSITRINISSPNKTTYWKLPSVHLLMSSQDDTSIFKPWLTEDPAPQLSANPLCLTQSRRRLKTILWEKQNGQPREELITKST
jgi:hypothetical protein